VREEYPRISGTRGIREENFRSTEDLEFQALRAGLEHQPIYFPRGSSAIRGENQAVLALMIPALRHLGELAGRTDRVLLVEASPNVDSTGGDPRNELLIQERAEAVVAHLRRQGIPAQLTSALSPIGDVSTEPNSLRRRVTLQVSTISI